MATKKKAVRVTNTNLFALAEVILASPDGIVRRMHSGDVRHVRRTLDAGLIAPTGEKVGRGQALALTRKGYDALMDEAADFVGSGLGDKFAGAAEKGCPDGICD